MSKDVNDNYDAVLQIVQNVANLLSIYVTEKGGKKVFDNRTYIDICNNLTKVITLLNK